MSLLNYLQQYRTRFSDLKESLSLSIPSQAVALPNKVEKELTKSKNKKLNLRIYVDNYFCIVFHGLLYFYTLFHKLDCM